MIEKKYPAKILLFGEYGILYGADALAIPSQELYTIWEKQVNLGLKNQLSDFLNYLKQNHFHSILNLESFEDELENNLILSSNIPEGYGAGSSGVVTAAVYDRFAFKQESDLAELRNIFQKMENFFHNKSSGIDPLVSFLNQSVMIQNKEIHLLNLSKTRRFIFELIDTHIPRSTQKYVAIFQEQMKQNQFHAFIMNSYLPLIQSCIESYLQEDAIFLENIFLLSEFQFRHFQFAIPEKIKQDWLKALQYKHCVYKLCGAGGGGFMIKFLL